MAKEVKSCTTLCANMVREGNFSNEALFPCFLSSTWKFETQLALVFEQAAISMLKQEYKEEGVSLKEALSLAINVLSKTLDVQKLSTEKGTSFHITLRRTPSFYLEYCPFGSL